MIAGKVGKALDQSVYGSRGILRDSDFYSKQHVSAVELLKH